MECNRCGQRAVVAGGFPRAYTPHYKRPSPTRATTCGTWVPVRNLGGSL